MIEDAHKEKRQFLSGIFFFLPFFFRVGHVVILPFKMFLSNDFSGKLHNLARAIADEETEPDFVKGEGSSADQNQKAVSEFDKDGVLGLGLRVIRQKALPSATGEINEQPADYDVKETGKRLFGPISNKPTTYLSQFILHIAAIGDIVDGTDTTHDFNFFSLVYEWPKDVRPFSPLNYLKFIVVTINLLSMFWFNFLFGFPFGLFEEWKCFWFIYQRHKIIRKNKVHV